MSNPISYYTCEEAEDIKKQLEEAGATVTFKYLTLLLSNRIILFQIYTLTGGNLH